MLIFFHHHFQLSSLYNWPSSGVCPVYNIPFVGVKGTSSVLWSSANFCSISQNMHYKAPVASQHWKTNKVVWTWKDNWPPWRTSTYKRPFTQEGNYLAIYIYTQLGSQLKLCNKYNNKTKVAIDSNLYIYNVRSFWYIVHFNISFGHTTKCYNDLLWVNITLQILAIWCKSKRYWFVAN